MVEVSEMKPAYRQTSTLRIYFITSFEKKKNIELRSNKESIPDLYHNARHSQQQSHFFKNKTACRLDRLTNDAGKLQSDKQISFLVACVLFITSFFIACWKVFEKRTGETDRS